MLCFKRRYIYKKKLRNGVKGEREKEKENFHQLYALPLGFGDGWGN